MEKKTEENRVKERLTKYIFIEYWEKAARTAEPPDKKEVQGLDREQSVWREEEAGLLNQL